MDLLLSPRYFTVLILFISGSVIIKKILLAKRPISAEYLNFAY